MSQGGANMLCKMKMVCLLAMQWLITAIEWANMRGSKTGKMEEKRKWLRAWGKRAKLLSE